MMAQSSGNLIDPLARSGADDAFPLPDLEVITGPGREPPVPWYRARRMQIFLSVFLLVLVSGLAWDFLRPAQYRATATLLTEQPQVDGRAPIGQGPEIQHIAVQKRLLLAADLLDDALKRAGQETALTVTNTGDLERMLEVTPVPDTNLVELGAVGSEQDELAPLVNSWISAYLDFRRRELEREVGSTLDALRREQAALGRTIQDKTEELKRYRGENDIVTMERDGNEALMRLKALQQDLNRARDESVEAEARLAATEASRARGDPVVPAGEQGVLNELEARAAQLRGKLVEMEERYLPLFLENHPEYRVLPAQLRALESQIEQKLAHGRGVVSVQARQEVEQARRRVEVLERDLAQQKEVATNFTTNFSRFQAMQRDLAGVQKMQEETGARLVELQAKQLEKYPSVEVIEAAHRPSHPFYPAYWRDALWVVLAAVMAALVAVWLTEYLTRRPQGAEAPIPVTGVRVYAAGQAAAIGAGLSSPALYPAAPAAALRRTAPPASLPGSQPRELIPAEVGALWDLAEPMSRQLMTLLLSGLSLDECAALRPEHFDLMNDKVYTPGPWPREIPLPPAVRDLFAHSDPLPLWAGADYRQTPTELSRRIGLLAHDAGLSQPAEVGAATLRHSYIAFLVRQGARLTELEYRIGAMPATELTRYADLAPAGQAKSLTDVETIYPTLKTPSNRILHR